MGKPPAETSGSAVAGAHAEILAEARAAVAAGAALNLTEVEHRLRAATASIEGAAADASEAAAVSALKRIESVLRARALLTREPEQTPVAQPPAPPVAAPRPLSATLRTKPTITGNMTVTRESDAGGARLAWEGSPAVATWEVRISDRPDPRGEYVVRETHELESAVTSIPITLGPHPSRIHVVGRGRDGRPILRTIISSVSEATWADRWTRKASAS